MGSSVEAVDRHKDVQDFLPSRRPGYPGTGRAGDPGERGG